MTKKISADERLKKLSSRYSDDEINHIFEMPPTKMNQHKFDLISISNKSSSEYILDTSKEYSIYVCSNRAIPNVSDGLKDCQRKALWLIKSMNDKIKTISLVGSLISSNLYVHGDASAAKAISMLAAPYCNNVPLLEGIGTFGTRVAPVEGIASPRYTYIKKNKASENILFRDIDVIPLKDNYDASTQEPETFLPLIPTVLLNGVSGIAVGWSTEILPRNLNDLIEATINVVDGKALKLIQPKYDYFNLDIRHIAGNSWEFSGKVKILDTSTIQITELPPDLTLEQMKERLNLMEDDDKISGYMDESTDKISLKVKFKRGTISDWSESKAIDFFKLKQKTTERIVVINWDGKSIKQYDTAEQVVVDFVEWRLTYYKKRFEKLIYDDSYELKYWKSLEECFKQKLSEKVVKINNKKELEDEVKIITSKIGPDDYQIDKIVSQQTFKWAKDYIEEIKKQIEQLENNIKENTSILSDPDKIRGVYRTELTELKKIKI